MCPKTTETFGASNRTHGRKSSRAQMVVRGALRRLPREIYCTSDIGQNERRGCSLSLHSRLSTLVQVFTNSKSRPDNSKPTNSSSVQLQPHNPKFIISSTSCSFLLLRFFLLCTRLQLWVPLLHPKRYVLFGATTIQHHDG